jgi:hypothetical protein
VLNSRNAIPFQDMIRVTVDRLHNAGYPPNTLHTFAVKANPVGNLLRVFRDTGCGAEVLQGLP